MKILIVDDDELIIETIETGLKHVVPNIKLESSKSLGSAMELLENNYYDLVVCDLKIPSVDFGLDKSVDHGLSVVEKVKNSSKGTILFVISGYGTAPITRDSLSNPKVLDIYGTGNPIALTDYFTKKELTNCIERIIVCSALLSDLESVEIKYQSDNELRFDISRVIKIFCKKYNATMVELKLLPGGLSSNKVYELDIYGEKGNQVGFVVGKLGAKDIIIDERNRFRKFVALMLDVGSYPSELELIDYGPNNFSGFFQSKIDPKCISLFQLLGKEKSHHSLVIRNLENIQKKWIRESVTQTISIKEIREKFRKSDLHLNRPYNENKWIEFEEKNIKSRVGIQHGDLHPANVLVKNYSDPLMIDFGRTEDHFPMITDSINLELSLFFHPLGIENIGGWFEDVNIENWFDQSLYLQNCPFPEFIVGCREWTDNNKASDEEVLAVIYSISARQLKYHDGYFKIAVDLMNFASQQS